MTLLVCDRHVSRNSIPVHDEGLTPPRPPRRTRREKLTMLSQRWIAEQEARKQREQNASDMMARAIAHYRMVEVVKIPQRIIEVADDAQTEQPEPETRRFRHSYAEIEQRAVRLFNVTQIEIRSNRRNAGIVIARQFIMYWATRLTTFSMPAIGRMMGGRDHTTILHGRRAYVQKRAAQGRKLREAR